MEPSEMPLHTCGMSRNIILPVVAILLCLPLIAVAQPPNSGNSIQSYGAWGVRWFQWAMPASTASSPLLGPAPDVTPRAHCAYSGKGSVWFLADSIYPVPATRECALPPGSAIFFPVVWGFWVRSYPGEATYKFVKTTLREMAENTESMFAVIDGVPLTLPPLIETPAFSFETSADNILGAPAGRWNPTAGCGIWVMLGPLSPGSHTLHYGVTYKDGSKYDTTFVLTVNE